MRSSSFLLMTSSASISSTSITSPHRCLLFTFITVLIINYLLLSRPELWCIFPFFLVLFHIDWPGLLNRSKRGIVIIEIVRYRFLSGVGIVLKIIIVKFLEVVSVSSSSTSSATSTTDPFAFVVDVIDELFVFSSSV